jgi:hypothetical protein
MNKNIILDVTLKFVLSFISIGMAIFTLARQPYHNPPLFQRVWKILGGKRRLEGLEDLSLDRPAWISATHL